MTTYRFVEIVNAHLEHRADGVGHDPRNRSDHGRASFGADQTDLGARIGAEILRQPRADRHAIAARRDGRDTAREHMARDHRIFADVLEPHPSHEHALDASVGGSHQRLFDQRQRRRDSGQFLRLVRNVLPVGQAAVIALDDRMAVEAHDLVEQLGAEAVHHAHHDDQRGDSKRHGEQADRRDKEDEPFALAGKQVAASDRALVPIEDHSVSLAKADSTLSSCRSPDERRLSSTVPAAIPRGPTISCQGKPIISIVASFAPPRSSRSS